MTVKTLAARGAATLAFLAVASIAVAQPGDAGPAAPAMPAVNYGPPIAGVCAVSRREVLAESAVGKAFADRMNTLQNEVAAELQPQATELASEQKTLQASTTPEQARINAFEQKAAAYQKLHDERLQELDYTNQKQLNRLLLELQPVLVQVLQQKQCSILLDRDQAVLGVNPSMDITGSAIIGLNARITTITFDREAPPAQPGAGSQ